MFKKSIICILLSLCATTSIAVFSVNKNKKIKRTYRFIMYKNADGEIIFKQKCYTMTLGTPKDSNHGKKEKTEVQQKSTEEN